MAFLPYLALMRPRQWVKNLLIGAPAFFGGALMLPGVFSALALTFVAFSLIASAVYVCNDIVDRAEDARHPKKAARPLASGRARRAGAYSLLAALLTIGGLLASLVPFLLPVLAAYLLLNILYTFWLKQIPIIDTVVVATSYVLRIVAGGVAALVTLSPWIVLATFFLALFLVSAKRWGEFQRLERRSVLNGYSRETLDALLIGSMVLSISAYGMWAVLVHPSEYAEYSIILVTAVMFRVYNRIQQSPEGAESPETFVFTDWWTLSLTVGWGVLMGVLFYIA